MKTGLKSHPSSSYTDKGCEENRNINGERRDDSESVVSQFPYRVIFWGGNSYIFSIYIISFTFFLLLCVHAIFFGILLATLLKGPPGTMIQYHTVIPRGIYISLQKERMTKWPTRLPHLWTMSDVAIWLVP